MVSTVYNAPLLTTGDAGLVNETTGGTTGTAASPSVSLSKSSGGASVLVRLVDLAGRTSEAEAACRRGVSVFGSKLSSSSSIERGTKSAAMMGILLYRNENRATLFPSLRKA